MCPLVLYRSTSREGVSLAGRPKNINVTDADHLILSPILAMNKIDSFSHGIITLCPKIVLKDRIVISSRDFTWSTRIYDYTVCFMESNSMNYGRVKSFSCVLLHLKKALCAIIQWLHIQSCRDLLRIKFPAEIHPIKNLLCEDYFSVTEDSDKVAVPVESILSMLVYVLVSWCLLLRF